MQQKKGGAHIDKTLLGPCNKALLASGASPPSRTAGMIFLYIYIYSVEVRGNHAGEHAAIIKARKNVSAKGSECSVNFTPEQAYPISTQVRHYMYI